MVTYVYEIENYTTVEIIEHFLWIFWPVSLATSTLAMLAMFQIAVMRELNVRVTVASQ